MASILEMVAKNGNSADANEGQGQSHFDEEYKLTYFNFRGAAEPIRWIFKLKNVKFQDIRLTKDESWFGDLKNSYPWGVLPVLGINGEKMLSQSTGIARYLARKFGLTGNDEWEAAICDELVDAMNDMRKEWKKYWNEVDLSLKAELREEFLNTTVPEYFKRFSEFLTNNEDGWLVSSRVTWADLYVAHFLELFEMTVDENILDGYPLLKEFKGRVFNIPRIKQWVKERPTTFL